MTPAPRTIRARDLRLAMSKVEWRLWSRLRMRQLDGWKFRRQAPIGTHYIADFYSPAARLVVEVDGPSHDDERCQHDSDRDAWMRSRGHRVLRFTAEDVVERLDDIVEEVRLELLSGPHPTLPVKRGGD